MLPAGSQAADSSLRKTLTQCGQGHMAERVLRAEQKQRHAWTAREQANRMGALAKQAAPEQRGHQAAHIGNSRLCHESALLLPEARAVRKAALIILLKDALRSK